MKKKTLIFTGIGALALAGTIFAVPAIADSDDDDCRRGEYGERYHKKDHKGMMGGFWGHHRMGGDLNLTPERVKEIVEGKIAWMGNENLKVGKVTTAENGLINAEIVTKDGSLVETFQIDPKSGKKSFLR